MSISKAKAEYKAQLEAKMALRNEELAKISQYSATHAGAYLVWFKQHYPCVYKLTGRYAVSAGVMNLECTRNSAGTTFFKATQGSDRFFVSLIIGDQMTCYRAGKPEVMPQDYQNKIWDIIRTQKSVKGITVLSTPVSKPAPVIAQVKTAPVVTAPVTVSTPRIAQSVQDTLTEIRTLLFKMFGTEGKIDSDLPIVRAYIALQGQAKIMKVAGFKQSASSFKREYHIA